MPRRMLALNGRDFLRLFPAVLGSTMFATSRAEQRAGEGAVASSRASATVEPGTFAETIFMSGKVVTMDAADSITVRLRNRFPLISVSGPDGLLAKSLFMLGQARHERWI